MANLPYPKYMKADVSTEKAPDLRPWVSPELMPQLVDGFKSHTITGEDVVKWKNGDSPNYKGKMRESAVAELRAEAEDTAEKLRKAARENGGKVFIR